MFSVIFVAINNYALGGRHGLREAANGPDLDRNCAVPAFCPGPNASAFGALAPAEEALPALARQPFGSSEFYLAVRC
jgi:hypothetical protein